MSHDPVTQAIDQLVMPNNPELDEQKCRDALDKGLGVLEELSLGGTGFGKSGVQHETPRFPYIYGGKMIGFVWLEGVKCVDSETGELDYNESFIVLRAAPTPVHPGTDITITTGINFTLRHNSLSVSGTQQDMNFTVAIFRRMKLAATRTTE